MGNRINVAKLVAGGIFLITGGFSTTSLAFLNQIDPMLEVRSHRQLTELQETSQMAEDIWGKLTGEFVTQYESGDYAKAAVTAKVAYELAERSFGPNHVNTADSLLKLGIITDTLGNSTQAKEYLLGALTILEDELNPLHVDVAVVLTNLANVYFEEGNNDMSEEFHTRALKIRLQNYGENDPTVAQSMYNLAVLYDEVKDYDKATALYEKSLEIWYDSLGAMHPYVANALNNLGNVYVAQGNFELATELHKHSLSIRRQLYGNDHPEVARAIVNLASLYVKDNDYRHAQPLYEEAVTLSEKLFGPTHPQVGMLLYSLANIYHIRGRMDLSSETNISAELTDANIGDIRKATFSQSHDTARDYFQRALPLYERALAIFDNSMHSDHPAIIAMINELALLYKSVGKFKKAEKMQARLSHQP